MKTDLWPTTGVQFTSDEHAAILAGLVAKNSSGVPRAGVLPRHTNPLVTARPDMRVNILPMELVHVKEGARFAALTETIDVLIPNPPSANTQYNIVCYVGTDSKLTSVPSTSDFVVVPGSPSATPADPALPDSAIPLARVAVPSTATATNSAGVVITPLHPFTAAAGSPLLFRSSVELNAWAAAEASVAYNLADGFWYVRSGGNWRGGSVTLTVDSIYDKHVAPYNAVAWCDHGEVFLEGLIRNAALFGANSGTRYVFGSIPVAYAPARTLRFGTVSVLGFAVIEVTTTGELAYWISASVANVTAGSWNLSLSGLRWKVQ